MTQAAVIFMRFPSAGLAQLVERWFCNPPSFPIKSTGSRGKSRVRRRSGCEIPDLTERSAARKPAQSILSQFAPEESS